MAYLHPILGGLSIAFLAYVGSLGLRARSDRRHAPALLARHAWLAPIVACPESERANIAEQRDRKSRSDRMDVGKHGRW